MARRFLAPQARQGDGHGYLSQPQRPFPIVADEQHVVERIASASDIRDEPEAPSGAWVDAESELAAERNRVRLLRQAEQAQQDRQSITVENRMRDAHRRAKMKHVDCSREFMVLRKMLGRGKDVDAVMRLELLEARLDGVSEFKEAA